MSTETTDTLKVANAINAVLRETLASETEEQLAKTCLSIVEELTSSAFGFLGELNDDGLFDTIAISDPGWDACRMPGSNVPRLVTNMPLRGIDRSTLLEGRSRVVNDLESHPDRVGTPEGHPPLHDFLGVPLKRGDETVGMIALANKPGGYTSADREAVEQLALAVVEALMRRRTQDALREEKEKYRTLAESTPGMVYRARTDWTTELLWNSVGLCGYTAEELATPEHAWLTVIHPDDAGRVAEEAATLTGGPGKLVQEYRIVTKDGRTIWVEDRKVPRFANDGSYLGVDGIVIDVTERKELQVRLAQSDRLVSVGCAWGHAQGWPHGCRMCSRTPSAANANSSLHLCLSASPRRWLRRRGAERGRRQGARRGRRGERCLRLGRRADLHG